MIAALRDDLYLSRLRADPARDHHADGDPRVHLRNRRRALDPLCQRKRDPHLVCGVIAGRSRVLLLPYHAALDDASREFVRIPGCSRSPRRWSGSSAVCRHARLLAIPTLMGPFRMPDAPRAGYRRIQRPHHRGRSVRRTNRTRAPRLGVGRSHRHQLVPRRRTRHAFPAKVPTLILRRAVIGVVAISVPHALPHRLSKHDGGASGNDMANCHLQRSTRRRIAMISRRRSFLAGTAGALLAARPVFARTTLPTLRLGVARWGLRPVDDRDRDRHLQEARPHR